MQTLQDITDTTRDLPLGWIIASVTVWTLAAAFIVLALVVLLPPLVRELKAWSRTAFRAPRVIDFDERRRQLDAAVSLPWRRL